MTTFPLTSAVLWVQQYNKERPCSNSQRIGQHFYNYFKCHRIVEPESVDILNKLYELDGLEAVDLIKTLIDHEN